MKIYMLGLLKAKKTIQTQNNKISVWRIKSSLNLYYLVGSTKNFNFFHNIFIFQFSFNFFYLVGLLVGE